MNIFGFEDCNSISTVQMHADLEWDNGIGDGYGYGTGNGYGCGYGGGTGEGSCPERAHENGDGLGFSETCDDGWHYDTEEFV